MLRSMSFLSWLYLWMQLCSSSEEGTVALSTLPLNDVNKKFLDTWNKRNFLVVWNTESDVCSRKYGIDIHFDLDKYGIVRNSPPRFYGDKINIFYELGKFAYTNNGIEYDGGLPQLGNLTRHLLHVEDDILKAIPDQKFSGLGVIDFEAWRPDWDTNWFPFDIYQRKSYELVKERNHTLSKTTLQEEARRAFESAAKQYMLATLHVVKKLRPHASWGYYGFPDCYNYGYLQKYCSNSTQGNNDEIQWLFNSSNVLYPSIYISQKAKEFENAVFVYGRLHEANRLSINAGGRPVLAYSSLFYRNTDIFLTKEDLLGTIGQAAALGFPGVILWARYTLVNSSKKCQSLQEYIHNTLGPTVKQIKSVLQLNPDYPLFSDDIPNEEWASRILNFFTN